MGRELYGRIGIFYAGVAFYFCPFKWEQGFVSIQLYIAQWRCTVKRYSGAKLKKGMGTKTPHLTNTVGVGGRSVGESQSLGRPEKAGLFWVYASRENYCARVNIAENGYGGIAPFFRVLSSVTFLFF